MAAITASGLIVLLVMFWIPAAPAGEVPAGEQAASQAEPALAPASDPDTARAGPGPGKGTGGTVFWVVLALALLFVLGSALALNGLGGKPPPPRQGRDGGGRDEN